MSFVYVFLAGLCEVCWPFGFKLSQTTAHHCLWIAFSLAFMSLSVAFYYLAQRQLPAGVVYPIWTAIGAIGTFLVSTFYFHDMATWLSWLGLLLIVTGIVILEQSS